MPDAIKVGGAEFQLLVALPAFKQAMEQQAPEIARSGSQKIAKELEAGAKQGADAQITQIRHVTDAQIKAHEQDRELIKKNAQVRNDALKEINRAEEAAEKQSAQRRAKAPGQFASGVAQGLGIGTTLEVVNGLQRGMQALVETTQDAVKIQDELNTAYGKSTVELGALTNSDAAFKELNKSAQNLGNTLAVALAPALAAGAQALALLLRGLAELEHRLGALGGTDTRTETNKLNAQQDANSEEATKKRQRDAQELEKAEVDSIRKREAAQISALDAQKKIAEDNAKNQRDRITQLRDAQLKASDEEKRGVLQALQDEEEARKDAYAAARARLENLRDAELDAAEKRRDAALKALDAESQARDDARTDASRELDRSRTSQDRAREESNRATLDGIEKEKTAYSKAVDDEIDQAGKLRDAKLDAIGKARDAALEGITREMDAEDERHRAALDNIDQEKNRRIDAIDAQLRKLSDADRKANRADTQQGLQENLQDAQRGLILAQRQGDPIAANRAQRDLVRAQRDISKEARTERSEDQRQKLEDQKAGIQREVDNQKRAEDQKNREIKRGLDQQKTDQQKAYSELLDQTKTLADNEITALQKSKEAKLGQYDEQLKKAQETEKNLEGVISDQRKAEDQAIADRQTAEDRAEVDRRKAITDHYDFERDQINKAYNDPETGLIPALAKQELEEQRSLDRRKQAIILHYQDEQTKIRETADYHLHALEIMTSNLTSELEKQKVKWREWSNFAIHEANTVRAQANAPAPPAGTQQTGVSGTGPLYAGSAGQATGGYGIQAGSAASQSYAGLSQQELNNIVFGGAHARGGTIPEPTLLTSLRTGRPYGIAGEAGSETIVPHGAGGNISISMPVTVNGANIQDQDRLASTIVDRAAAKLASLLNSTQLTAGRRVSQTLPGAQ